MGVKIYNICFIFKFLYLVFVEPSCILVLISSTSSIKTVKGTFGFIIICVGYHILVINLLPLFVFYCQWVPCDVHIPIRFCFHKRWWTCRFIIVTIPGFAIPITAFDPIFFVFVDAGNYFLALLLHRVFVNLLNNILGTENSFTLLILLSVAAYVVFMGIHADIQLTFYEFVNIDSIIVEIYSSFFLIVNILILIVA